MHRLMESRGSLAELYSGRKNSIGFIRLLLAVAVVLSHSKPLGFGDADLGYFLFREQTNVGTLAVYGFFVLSGALITRSARRTGLLRYSWHRVLRIMPALWVCLIVTALIVAPLIFLREHGTIDGLFAGPDGPLQYLKNNWWTGVRQYGIHDLLASSTPWGRHTGASVFDGALWSLAYEMLCYIMIGVLAVTGVLHNARRFVLVATGIFYLVIASDYVRAGAFSGPVDASAYGVMDLPFVGGMSYRWIIYLGFLFLLGATFDLYRERIPIHDGLGILSAVVFAGTLLTGGFFVLGFPAFAYLLIWLAVRMPRQFHWVGQKNDYSYGIYIYGFVFQQVFASLGWARWGYGVFALISVAAAFAAAYLSWHLVEKHAMHFKGWTPALLTRWREKRSTTSDTEPSLEPAAAEAAAAEPATPEVAPQSKPDLETAPAH